MSELTHLDREGRACMVDVSHKAETRRVALASARLVCAPETLALVREGRTPKGAVVSVAEIAGIMAAKRTADLVPMCHPLPLSRVAVSIRLDDELPGFRIEAETVTVGQTGVEMEALTAVTVAGLTLYDMLKAVDRGMRIEAVELIAKSGGVGGDWRKEQD